MLDFYQIIFNESQRGECYPFAKVHFNETLTDFFENDVICRLVPESNADYISVCSWRLKQKRGKSSTPMVLNHKLELSEEKILSQDFDVAILTPRRAGFLPLYMASSWHGKHWDEAFKVFNEGFLHPNGIGVKQIYGNEAPPQTDLKYAIHENHFIARGGLYKMYVNYCLIPAIEFMKSNTDIFLQDSGYAQRKRDPEEIQAYQKVSGRKDWPIAPFILERLFSIWINNKDLKIINL